MRKMLWNLWKIACYALALPVALLAGVLGLAGLVLIGVATVFLDTASTWTGLPAGMLTRFLRGFASQAPAAPDKLEPRPAADYYAHAHTAEGWEWCLGCFDVAAGIEQAAQKN